MAYKTTNLIARRGYGAMGGVTDFLKGAASSAIDFFGSKAKAEGASEAMAAQNAQLAAALAARQSPPPSNLLLYGGIGLAAVAAVLILKKRN